MRILHVVPSYLPATRYGGPIQSVHGLCGALARLGHDVHVFTTNIDGPEDSDVPLGQSVDKDGVKVWYFPSRRLRRLFYAPDMAFELKRQLADFDVLHLHSVFLWPTMSAARSARKLGVPYVLAPRGMLNTELIRKKSRWVKNAWIKIFERRNIEEAALLHFTSQIEGKEAAKFGFRLPTAAYVPNGIDSPKIKNRPDVESGRRSSHGFTLFLGRINWKKGLGRLLESWKYVPGERLVIAGNDEEGYIPELTRLAQSEGVIQQVEFVGPVAGERKWELLSTASLFVLPSYSENFGIAVLEAMAAGCPVVVTPEVGLASTVQREKCGVVVEGEPETLGKAIAALLSDEAARKNMGDKGKQVAREQFSWEAIASEMEQNYRRIMKRRSANAMVAP